MNLQREIWLRQANLILILRVLYKKMSSFLVLNDSNLLQMLDISL